MANSAQSYFEQSHKPVPRRELIWQVLGEYVQSRWLPAGLKILDLGAGYCAFINNVSGERRVAVDLNPDIRSFAETGVETIVSSATDLSMIPSGSMDSVFSSNLFEHLDYNELFQCVRECKRVLRKDGRLILLLPNFFYGYREYFHDYTHRTILTHVGMSDLLEAEGFNPIAVFPKFLPFSMQKKYGGFSTDFIPSSFLKFLIKMYLLSPVKPFAKQMFLVFSNK